MKRYIPRDIAIMLDREREDTLDDAGLIRLCRRLLETGIAERVPKRIKHHIGHCIGAGLIDWPRTLRDRSIIGRIGGA